MSVLGSDMETHSASFWSFNHCFASPPSFFTPAPAHWWFHLYFQCCKMQCYLSLLAPVFCRGSLVTFVLLPSGAAAICTLFTRLILNLHCVVLCCCRVSSLAHCGHVKANGPNVKCSWQTVIVPPSQLSLSCYRTGLQYMTLSKQTNKKNKDLCD